MATATVGKVFETVAAGKLLDIGGEGAPPIVSVLIGRKIDYENGS